MSLSRLLIAASVLALLAACGDSPPAPDQTAAATPAPATTTTTVAAETQAPAAAASTPAAAAPPAPAASDDAMAPLVGLWSADLATCGSTPIRITPTTFEGAENQCQIGSLTDNGDGSVTAALDCVSEGARTSENIVMRPLFAPTGEGIGLTYPQRDNAEVTLLRCLQPPSQ